MKKNTIILLLLYTIATTIVTAQQKEKVEAVFPVSVEGLLYWEAESAVASNFSKEATQDYASSGFRILQLNKDPQAPGAPFFAEYALYVPEDGVYNLWLAGTPPGPKDKQVPSFASPFEYQIDEGMPVPIYREDVHVVESFAVSNYWSMIKKPIQLKKGIHSLRIIVNQKRSYDNRYYFYLDALFLAKSSMGNFTSTALPAKFPKNMQARDIDSSYKTINQYEERIAANNKDMTVYIELANVYSMISDYQNAIKTLERSRLNLGNQPEILLLLAKNRIWSGEFDLGLQLYKEYLATPASSLAIWAEVAKVMAWLGKYQDSLNLYNEALVRYPGNLNLIVNQALTRFWAGNVNEGEQQLEQAWDLAKKQEQDLKNLASIYTINGYPEKTVETYSRGLEVFPNSLEIMLLLEDSYLKNNQKSRAAQIRGKIEETFVASEALSQLLETSKNQNSTRDKILGNYRLRLVLKPDDVKLRQELIDAYFWNNLKEEAINETINMLINQLYKQFGLMDKELEKSYLLMDKVSLLSVFLASSENQAKALQDAVQKAVSALQSAKQANSEQDFPDLQANVDSTSNLLAAWLSTYINALKTIENLQSDLQSEQRAFEKTATILQEKSPWQWNRGFYFNELNQGSANKNSLADYLLCRIALFENQSGSARQKSEILAKLTSLDKPMQSLVTQTALWLNGQIPDEKLDLYNYYDYGSEINSLSELLKNSAPLAEQFSTDTAKDLLRQTEALLKNNPNHFGNLVQNKAALIKRMKVRMEIQMYQFELETFETRYKLADYYLSSQKYKTARDQLEMVIGVAPFNINARFNLARARQLSGDWSGAMSLYKEIFKTDPKFENTASLYNLLAKNHADRVAGSLTSFWDTNRQEVSGLFAFTAGGSSILGLNASYENLVIRLSKRGDINDPVSINLHDLNFSFPINFSDINFSITPSIGGKLKNEFFDQNVPADQSLVLEDIFSYMAVAPNFGLNLKLGLGELGLESSYKFNQVEDTFFPLRTPTFEHDLDLSATIYVALPAPSALQSIGSRTYGKVAAMFSPFSSDINTLYTITEDLNFTFLLNSNPWTTLVLTAIASYEDSDDPTVLEYYAPNAVFNAKGGVQFSSSPALGEGWVFGYSLRGLAGLYHTESQDLLSLEGLVHLELNRSNLSIFLDISTSVTTNGTTSDYFSFNAVIGARIAVPDYLIP